MELNRAKNLDTTLLQKLKTMKKLNMMRKIEWRERLQLQIDNSAIEWRAHRINDW